MERRTRNRWGIALALVTLSVLALYFLVPEIVRRRAIAEAHARGIELHIGGARLTFSGIELSKLDAHLEKVPGAVVTAKEATVGLSGFTPREIDLTGMDVSLPDLLAAAPQIESQRAATTQITGDLARIAFQHALVHLARFAGPSTSLEMSGVSAEIVVASPGSGGAGGSGDAVDEAHVRADAVTGTLGASPFGPWRVTVDHTREGAGSSTRTRWTLDPAETARISTTNTATASTLDVKIPRSHVRALGLPDSAFGLSAEDVPEIEVDASAMLGAASGASGDATRTAEGALLFQVWGTHLGALPNAVEMKLGGKWKGQGETVAIHDGVFAIGPFAGTVQGTVRTGGAPRLDFTFDSAPIPCADFGMPTKAVTGAVTLSGSMVFDLTSPAENRLTLKPSADCSISLLPSSLLPSVP